MIMERKKKRKWAPEDVRFGSCFQPSTIGTIYSCLYTVVINRGFTGLFNYPVGIAVLSTINPSEHQTSGFANVIIPEIWNPTVIDCRSQAILTSAKRAEDEVQEKMKAAKEKEASLKYFSYKSKITCFSEKTKKEKMMDIFERNIDKAGPEHDDHHDEIVEEEKDQSQNFMIQKYSVMSGEDLGIPLLGEKRDK